MYGNRKSKWLSTEELEYAQLRVKYANGPDAPTYQFRWSDVIAAAKDRKTFFMMMMFWWGGSVPTYSLSYSEFPASNLPTCLLIQVSTPNNGEKSRLYCSESSSIDDAPVHFRYHGLCHRWMGVRSISKALRRNHGILHTWPHRYNHSLDNSAPQASFWCFLFCHFPSRSRLFRTGANSWSMDKCKCPQSKQEGICNWATNVVWKCGRRQYWFQHLSCFRGPCVSTWVWIQCWSDCSGSDDTRVDSLVLDEEGEFQA